jgi:hypothetical protein
MDVKDIGVIDANLMIAEDRVCKGRGGRKGGQGEQGGSGSKEE